MVTSAASYRWTVIPLRSAHVLDQVTQDSDSDSDSQ
jgi:hypothetical protein